MKNNKASFFYILCSDKTWVLTDLRAHRVLSILLNNLTVANPVSQRIWSPVDMVPPGGFGPPRPISASGLGPPGGPNPLADMVSPRGFSSLVILFEERKYIFLHTHLRVLISTSMNGLNHKGREAAFHSGFKNLEANIYIIRQVQRLLIPMSYNVIACLQRSHFFQRSYFEHFMLALILKTILLKLVLYDNLYYCF